MNYIGLDIHKKSFTGTVLDEKDNLVVQHKCPYTMDGIKSFFGQFHPGRTKVAMEACGLWRGYYRILTALGYNVVLANPVKARERSNRKKTDPVDSHTLAELLRTGFIPLVYVPEEDVLKLRDIARHRARLVRMQTRTKTMIKAYLMRDGIEFPERLWNRSGLAWLSTRDDPSIGNLVNVYQCLHSEIKEVSGRVRKMAVNRKVTNILMSAPGIGEFTSVLMAAEIGDVKRFGNPKSLVSYAGLCPGVYQSGDTVRTQRNAFYNHWLKFAVYESSGRAVMLGSKYARHYARVKRRRNWKIARRSTARRMLTDVYWMLRNEEPYRAS